MTVLTAAEHGTIDSAASDAYHHVAHIGLFVKQYSLVALTATEEVAGHGVVLNLIQCAGHAERTVRHGDDTDTCGVHTVGTHVRHLVTTIDIRQDVAASDFYPSVATHGAGLGVPFARFIRVLTATAAEHVAIVRVAVFSGCGTILRIVARCAGIHIVCVVRCFVWPACTLVVRIVICRSDYIPYC